VGKRNLLIWKHNEGKESGGDKRHTQKEIARQKDQVRGAGRGGLYASSQSAPKGENGAAEKGPCAERHGGEKRPHTIRSIVIREGRIPIDRGEVKSASLFQKN